MIPDKVIKRTIDTIVNKDGTKTTKILETIEIFYKHQPISYYIK